MNLLEYLVGKTLLNSSGRTGHIMRVLDGKLYISWYRDQSKYTIGDSISDELAELDYVINIIKWYNPELKNSLKELYPEYLF